MIIEERNAIALDEVELVISSHSDEEESALDVNEEVILFEAEQAVEANEEVFELNMNEEPTVDYGTPFILNKPTNIYVEEENAPAFDEKNEVTAFDERNEVVSFDESNEDVALEESVVSAAVEHVQDASPMVEAVAPPENFETSFRVVLEEEPTMQLVVREEAFEATKAQARNTAAQNFEMPLDDSEEQRRKVRERIQKLRNLSFNIGNSNDQSAEFDEVPAYVRRNMDLFGNTLASVENYYSKYTVDQDDKNQTQISTINSFLDGKKPD
jgi:hypothetical protein